LVDDSNYGLGIYIATTSFSKIGFWLADKKGFGEERDRQTGYVAPFAPEMLDHNIIYTYNYSLIVGQLDFIRGKAYEFNAKQSRRTFSFENDRDHFYYKNITDQGFPTGGCLEFDFAPEGELSSPWLFMSNEDCKSIELEAEFEGEISGEVLCRVYDGLDERNWGKTNDFAIPFCINGCGEKAKYSLDISSAPAPFIGFSLRFKNEGHLKVYSVKI
jgi:hypothetical protein